MISYILSIRQSFRVFLVLVYLGCVVALSLLPLRDLPQVPMFHGEDKLIHCAMYFGFSVLFCWTLKTELNYSRLFLVIGITIGWGILMEILQLDMQMGRSFSWYDELANTVGVVFGVLTYLIATRESADKLSSKSV